MHKQVWILVKQCRVNYGCFEHLEPNGYVAVSSKRIETMDIFEDIVWVGLSI